jgi:response regulator RpfG family c-di-GMP phosphodiesterase
MPQKVLILDDNQDIRVMTAEILRRATKLVVIESDDPSYILNNYQPLDVVIFDLNIPKVNTQSFLKELWASDPFARCIVFTGEVDQKHLLALKDMGVGDFILKPCPISVVVKKVSRLLEKP